MAYYGNFASFPPQGVQNAQQVVNSGPFPTSYAQTGLASYGGGASSYRVNQPAYYAGPSYSTTSDNDYLNNLPVAGYGASTYGAGYNSNLGSYGAQNYACDPYAFNNQPSYSQAPQTASYSQAQVQPSNGEDLTQLAPQIEAAYEAATGHRRQPVIKRQVITIPGAPGRVQQVVRRLPTPTPDIVERVFVVKPQRDVVNLVIERPGTPPAQYKDRTIMGKPRKPLINPLIVRVNGRAQLPYNPCQPQIYQPYALPAPTPSLNANNIRIPPSSSYQYQRRSSSGPLPSQPTTSGHQQPSVSTTQYPSQLSQGQMSQGRLSQVSQSQLQTQTSNPHLSKQTKSGYVIAPIQYDDQQQQQQQQQQPQQQQTPTLQSQQQAPSLQAQQAAFTGQMNYPTATQQSGYAPTPSPFGQMPNQTPVFGAGYSTGFPSQAYGYAANNSPYPAATQFSNTPYSTTPFPSTPYPGSQYGVTF